MARGWESKSVEAQQAEREQKTQEHGPETPAEAARVARRRTLELTLARARADRAVAKSLAHQEMLDAAIRALEEQLGVRH